MKAILVIDMPNEFVERMPLQNLLADVRIFRKEFFLEEPYVARRFEVKIEPLPEKKDAMIQQGEINENIPLDFLKKVANQGYNACLDEILKEVKEEE